MDNRKQRYKTIVAQRQTRIQRLTDGQLKRHRELETYRDRQRGKQTDGKTETDGQTIRERDLRIIDRWGHLCKWQMVFGFYIRHRNVFPLTDIDFTYLRA